MITPNAKRLLKLLSTPKSTDQLQQFMGRATKPTLRKLLEFGLVCKEHSAFMDYKLTPDGEHVKRIFK